MTSDVDTHRVFLNKPSELLGLLSQRVELQTQRGERVSGGLIGVDPVTDTALLAQLHTDHSPQLDLCTVVAVPFVDWETLKVMESSPEYRKMIEELSGRDVTPETAVGGVEVTERRSRVIEELTRHGLEVKTEGEDLVISGTVIIQPPYSHHDCDAPNEIILARIRNLLQSIQ